MFDESTAGNIRSLEAKFENEKIANQLKVSRETKNTALASIYLVKAVFFMVIMIELR